MAQSPAVIRVIMIPLGSDTSNLDSLFTLPALTQAATNGWFTQLYSFMHPNGSQTPPGAISLTKQVRVEVITDSTNDANLVSTSLPALQTQLGLATPLVTWSYPATKGY